MIPKSEEEMEDSGTFTRRNINLSFEKRKDSLNVRSGIEEVLVFIRYVRLNLIYR